MSWLGWGSSAFDEAVDKATSELNVAGQEDIALNLEICDQVRSKSVAPKDAMRSMKRRLNHTNPNVQLLTFSLIDVCVKNGGDHFLAEISSREFMDNLVSILKQPAINRDVKDTILQLVQNWATAFEKKPNLSYTGEVYRTLQREGFKFPPKDAVNTAMVDTATAPEWIDSDVCLRCRTPFSFTNRKHHCRNCGQVFDQACSSKQAPLPHFGIPEPVRVCDTCHHKLKKKNERPANLENKLRRSHPESSKARRQASLEDKRLDEDLQRAIELSLKLSQSDHRAGYAPQATSSWGTSEPPVIPQGSRPSAQDEEEDDPELRAAIEASLRDIQAPKASAPTADEEAQADPGTDLLPLESDAIMTFSQTIEEAAARGTRDLVRYPGVSELYQRANTLRPKLGLSLEDASNKQEALADMHEKLSEAVKLYDRLLQAQISDSSRRYGEFSRGPTLSYQIQPRPQAVPQAPAPSSWQNPVLPQQQWNAPGQVYVPTQAPLQPQASAQPAPQRQFSGVYGRPGAVTPTPSQSSETWNAPQSPRLAAAPQHQAYGVYAPRSTASPSQQWAPQVPVQQAPPPPSQHVPSQDVHASAEAQYPPPPTSPVQRLTSPPTTHQHTPAYPTYSNQYTAPHPPTIGAPPPHVLASNPVAYTLEAPTTSFHLPSFPSAPTSAPQSYGFSAQAEPPKEAMLISFE